MNEIKFECPVCGSADCIVKGSAPYYDNPIIRDGVIINKKSSGTEFRVKCSKCGEHFTKKMKSVPAATTIHPVEQPREEKMEVAKEGKIEAPKGNAPVDSSTPTKEVATEKTTTKKSASARKGAPKKTPVKTEE